MGWLLGLITAVVVIVLATWLLWAFMAGVYWFSEYHPDQFFGVLLLLVAAPVLVMLLKRVRAGYLTGAHATSSGWESIDDPRQHEWPWSGLRLRGTIRVRRAWAFRAGGFPVIAGDVTWTGNALSGAVDPSDGSGVFVIVRLAAEAEPMAMRLPFEMVGDSPLLERASLRTAFLSNRIPAWTARGHELFTIEPVSGPIGPERIEECVQRALLVVELLRPDDGEPLRPDAGGPLRGEDG